jgi:hypothetical protein
MLNLGSEIIIFLYWFFLAVESNFKASEYKSPIYDINPDDIDVPPLRVRSASNFFSTNSNLSASYFLAKAFLAQYLLAVVLLSCSIGKSPLKGTLACKCKESARSSLLFL